MKPLKALVAVAAVAAVLGISAVAATAIEFQVEVSVGWVNSTGTCSPNTACLGFAGVGGFGAGTSTRLNWDNQTPSIDSYLSIGALPEVIGFPPNVGSVGAIPTGFGTTTIDVGETVLTAEIRHTNNAIPRDDDFLASITLQTLLRILSPDGTTEIIGDGTGGDLDVKVSFLETKNTAPCLETSNSLKSICDDQFTFVTLIADIPFEFEGISYVLEVRGLLNPDGSFACEDAGGGNVNCLTAEGQANDRFVAITLRQVDVPVVPAPASLLLLGLGLLGAGVVPMIRNRRSA
jgi:hypothetical protein